MSIQQFLQHGLKVITVFFQERGVEGPVCKPHGHKLLHGGGGLVGAIPALGDQVRHVRTILWII